MKPVFLAPLVALALAGGGAGAYFWVTSGGGTEEVVAQPTPTPEPAPTAPATPTPEPYPADTWTRYTDSELGFSLARPEGWVLSEQTLEYPPKNGNPAVQVRALTFKTAKGLFTLGLALAPNPAGLSLEDWVSTYPGWPGQPSNLVVGGQPALRFPIDQQGERFPQIYFEHEGVVYTVQVNVYGHQGKPPSVSETDFQRIIEEFRLPE